MTRVLSESGLGRQAVQEKLDEVRGADVDVTHPDWHHRVFLYSFHVDEEVGQVAHDAYLKYAKTDTLGPSVYPSLTKIQNDLVAIGLELLQGGASSTGSVTTGGTESIFLGMKTARDWAVENHPVSGITGGRGTGYGPSRIQQGGPLPGHEDGSSARGSGFSSGCSGHGRSDQCQHHRIDWLGTSVLARGFRS